MKSPVQPWRRVYTLGIKWAGLIYTILSGYKLHIQKTQLSDLWWMQMCQTCFRNILSKGNFSLHFGLLLFWLASLSQHFGVISQFKTVYTILQPLMKTHLLNERQYLMLPSVQFSVLSLPGFMTLDKLLKLSVSQFPHL